MSSGLPGTIDLRVFISKGRVPTTYLKDGYHAETQELGRIRYETTLHGVFFWISSWPELGTRMKDAERMWLSSGFAVNSPSTSYRLERSCRLGFRHSSLYNLLSECIWTFGSIWHGLR